MIRRMPAELGRCGAAFFGPLFAENLAKNDRFTPEIKRAFGLGFEVMDGVVLPVQKSALPSESLPLSSQEQPSAMVVLPRALSA
jgi:hypothetical protein